MHYLLLISFLLYAAATVAYLVATFRQPLFVIRALGALSIGCFMGAVVEMLLTFHF
jgi:hypothetical protein